MKILIVGLGYVGTTLFAALNSRLKKSNIVGLDKSEELIENFKKNKFTTYEKNLKKYFEKKNLNKLTFKKKISKNEKFDYVIICVGTPINIKKEIDNSMLFKSISNIKYNLKTNSLLIVRSSVKVGTMDLIKKKFFKNQKISMAYCPERTIEGNAVKEILDLPQLIGTEDLYSKKKCNLFFSKLTKTLINFNSFKEPEFVKLLDNYYRDTKFAFANEIGIMCEKIGVNAKSLIEKANYKFHRNNIPLPGPVGGPCLSKDPYILVNSFQKNSSKTKIYSRDTNERYIDIFSSKIIKEINSQKNRIKKILLVGITFKGKPDTNDIRNSTALRIIENIKKKFRVIKIFVYDKFASNEEIIKLSCIPINNLTKELPKFKIIIIHGNNNYIQKLNVIKFSKKMKKKSIIFDIWNNYNSVRQKLSKNVSYKGIGI